MFETFLSSPVVGTLITDFIRLILALIVLILLLRIVWRVEKKLDTVFKLLAVSFGFILCRQILRVLGDLEIFHLTGLANYLWDLIPTALYIWAFWIMNQVVGRVDKE